MTNAEKTLIELVQELPSTLHDEVRDFIEFLLEKQRRDLVRQAEANGWPKGFFERTAGSITDSLFTRPPQGDSEMRLPLEGSAFGEAYADRHPVEASHGAVW
jgi:Protein of unknown function (DUF2281)